MMFLAFTLSQVLSYPMPMALVRSGDGRTLAYEINQRGRRSIWVAKAPDYVPKEVVAQRQDDGQGITSVQVSRDGSYVVYVYGNRQNPSLSVQQPHATVTSANVATGATKALGEGYAPAVSPDGTRVAFIRKDAVWVAPIDGSAEPKQLFYDFGADSDLQWSPNGAMLAFVSTRDDHSFIGVYRGPDRPLEFLSPSVTNDMEPRWSPDGTQIAFARTPGAGGAPQSPLQMPIVPWSLMVSRVSDGATHVVWRSPHTSRASFPTQGGDIDLHWAAGDRLVFISEMDNWPHLYTMSAKGGRLTRLTTGPYAITSLGMSYDLRSVFFTANTGSRPDDIDRWHLFNVDVASAKTIPVFPHRRSPHARVFAEDDTSEWAPAPLADGHVVFITTTAQEPPLLALADAEGRHMRLLDRDLVPRNFPTAQLVTPTEVTYHAPDGTLIHAQLFRQPGRGREPGIIFVHGGPMRQMLLTWPDMDYYANSYAVDQYLVSRGFAVLSVNYRSSVDYGHNFHYAVRTGWTGASEYQDVLAGAKWLQRQTFVNPAKIGIWGGSWGGYLTALALARNSDVFKAGVDYSGVHDLMHDAKEYFQYYGEGTDNVNLRPWLHLAWESSPDSSVYKWRSPVLLIQGDEDPDVSFHQLVDLVPRLEQYHVPYQFMVLPDEAHGFLKWHSWLRADTAAVEFFERHLR
jgi:dipeptidyl aminopeptidase/acylaminoacyl peptidase